MGKGPRTYEDRQDVDLGYVCEYRYFRKTMMLTGLTGLKLQRVHYQDGVKDPASG
jgi:hypothetical protein